MYAVSNNYNKTIYSGDAKHRLSLLFDGVEYENANSKVEYVKVKSNILSNGEERFSLDNFVSKEVEIKIHNAELTDIVEPVNISIGTFVDNQYEYVPIGIFNLSETPTKDKDIVTVKLRDYSTKFDIYYNAEDVIEENDGKATMIQILQDICEKCGVELGTTSFINQDTEVSVWDNTVTARQYVMYIAEKAGSIATISRDGKLLLIPINANQLTSFELNTGLIESYTEDDKFSIARVVYEDAIRKYEYGTIPTREEIEAEITYPSLEIYPSLETYPSDTFENVWYKARQKTTLYISSSNPYITDTSEIENIYNSIKDFALCGLKITKIIGNPALDPYDLITFTYKGKTYTTFAQNTLTYNGVIIQSFETNIGTLEKAQENVTINTQQARWKKVYTEIDQMSGDIKFYTSEVSTASATANNASEGVKTINENLDNYYTIEQTNELIQNANTGLTNTFRTTGGANIFRNTGLWFATNDSNNPYEFWNGIVVKGTEYKSANRSCMILQNSTLEQEEQVSDGYYTVSFNYQKLIGVSIVKVIINNNEYSLENTDVTEFVQTINVNTGYINIKFVSDTDNSCEIYDLMVNVGNGKMPYSQNQNETTTDTVNISKGITITSSDTNTKFKADSDGTRIFNTETNEIKSEFTDKGMKTDELEANKGTIGGLLIQDVDGQTWLTRI